MNSICLNIMAKNEAHVIKRCIDSARPLINSYCITLDPDTTDNTAQIIKETLHDLPGQIHTIPWEGFGITRTKTMRLARGLADYTLLIDADDQFIGNKITERLTADWCDVMVLDEGLQYRKPMLLKSNNNFDFTGIIHECLNCYNGTTGQLIDSIQIKRNRDGQSWKQGQREKYRKDAVTLTDAVLTEPENERYWFYLAQSHRDAGQYQESIQAYEHRSKMPGWEEETWYSLYQIGLIQEMINADPIMSYLKAFELRPTRLEPLCRVGNYLRNQGQHNAVYRLLKPSLATPMTTDRLFVEADVWQWKLKDCFAVSAFYAGDKSASKRACQELLAGKLPANEIERVKQNLGFCK